MNKNKEEIEELVNDISHEICIRWTDYQKCDEPSFTDRIKHSDLLIINLLDQQTKELRDEIEHLNETISKLRKLKVIKKEQSNCIHVPRETNDGYLRHCIKCLIDMS